MSRAAFIGLQLDCSAPGSTCRKVAAPYGTAKFREEETSCKRQDATVRHKWLWQKGLQPGTAQNYNLNVFSKIVDKSSTLSRYTLRCILPDIKN